MPRIKLTLQYKGTNYLGWQIQPQGPTVQSVLEEKLATIFHHKIITVVSGRTDSGVHAVEQVVHFDVEHFSMKPVNLLMGLNSSLPPDISVVDVCEVGKSFHAQKSVRKKIYEYVLFNSQIPSPFLGEYSWRIPYMLNLTAMKRASKVLVGRHDFKAFCAADSHVKTTVRKIGKIQITLFKNPPLPPFYKGGESLLSFTKGGKPLTSPFTKGGVRGICVPRLILLTFEGQGFLKHMVRNIVGTLVDVGRGKLTEQDVKKILKSRDRKQAGRTAPPQGLVLKEVVY